MLYATAEDVAAGFRNLSDDEKDRCVSLLEEAAVIIDAYSAGANADHKKLVSCRMVRRILGDGGGNDAPLYPLGSTQGSVSAMGYSQSWTMGSGSAGELYLSKLEKKLLGVGDRIAGLTLYCTENSRPARTRLARRYLMKCRRRCTTCSSANRRRELVNELQLYGKRLAYTLALPKGDAHDWYDVTVEFFGQRFRTYGDMTEGIEAMIPLRWNRKVKVERYG